MQPVELSDPWTGPSTYAEDFYSGGDVIDTGALGTISADRLSALDAVLLESLVTAPVDVAFEDREMHVEATPNEVDVDASPHQEVMEIHGMDADEDELEYEGEIFCQTFHA